MTKAAILKVGSDFESALSVTALALTAALPLAAIAARELFHSGIPGTDSIVQHLTLWITFLGAALAARSDRLLALATANFLAPPARKAARIFTSALAAGMTSWMALASLTFIRVEGVSGEQVAWGIPIWVAALIVPIGFALIALRLIWTASAGWPGRALALTGLVVPLILMMAPGLAEWNILTPVLILLAVAAALGAPIFAVFGGAALLLFWSQGLGATSIPGEVYRLSASPFLPTVPLFALTGYLLAEGGASRRLMRLLNALIGWMPGSLAVVVTLVLAFFTTLGSSVTILSLGGLMAPLLLKSGYTEKASIGLVTVGGSTGLLFPPSLPVILYAIKAGIPIDRLYLGGLVPGLMLVAVVAAWGAFRGLLATATRQRFAWREAAAALWDAKWELPIPIVILAGVFGGHSFLVETAAFTVLYAFIIECCVHRELSISKDLPQIAVECVTLVGGFLIVLGVALSFTTSLNYADIPAQILRSVHAEIASPAVFLLALNGLFLLVGAIGETFSAIFVLVPLIAPLAGAYGIQPIHLGVIFLANMELGYLMPPMGANLFLAASRFGQPLNRVWLSTLPYLVLLFAVVMLVTYVPALTLAPIEWLK